MPLHTRLAHGCHYLAFRHACVRVRRARSTNPHDRGLALLLLLLLPLPTLRDGDARQRPRRQLLRLLRRPGRVLRTTPSTAVCCTDCEKRGTVQQDFAGESFPHTFVQVYFFRQVARQGTVSIPSLCRAGCPTIVVSHMLWLPTLRASDVHFHVVRSTECSDYVEYNRVKDRLFKPVEIFEVGARK